jgi:exosortase
MHANGIGRYSPWLIAGTALMVPFVPFLVNLWKAWGSDPEFSHGILMPFIVGYIVWTRREQLSDQRSPGGFLGLGVLSAGCGLLVLSSLSGTLIMSGIGFALAVLGTGVYLWGPRCFRVAAGPIGLLMLMVPLPSYVMGELSWRLQTMASTISSSILRIFGVPVFQDGNILNIGTYVLEVKQACSGSRSVFALFALALVLGIGSGRAWWTRFLLVVAAPVLAVGANVMRIVGTGFIAKTFGSLAANESLHLAWGIAVFVVAVSGLLAFHKYLQWLSNARA